LPAAQAKETSRERKRRAWRQRQEARQAGADSAAGRPPRCESWAYLPDIVLEEIFKYLSYRVGFLEGVKDFLILWINVKGHVE
jgi:hypothetical protein